VGAPNAPRAKTLALLTGLSFEVGRDDAALIDAEIEVVKRLGFNALYELPTTPADAHAFAAAHGLEPHFRVQERGPSLADVFADDLAVWDALMAQEALALAPLAGDLEMMTLADEPHGVP